VFIGEPPPPPVVSSVKVLEDAMAHANKKHFGPAAKGKGTGSGAMTDLPPDVGLGENSVLSNRDKSRHSDERGLDSRHVQTEQLRDHAGNRPASADEDAA
jgi:hypothetical protein